MRFITTVNCQSPQLLLFSSNLASVCGKNTKLGGREELCRRLSHSAGPRARTPCRKHMLPFLRGTHFNCRAHLLFLAAEEPAVPSPGRSTCLALRAVTSSVSAHVGCMRGPLFCSGVGGIHTSPSSGQNLPLFRASWPHDWLLGFCQN